MKAAFDVQITGAKEILSKLDRIEKKFARQSVKNALREGAEYLSQAMKSASMGIDTGSKKGMGHRIARAWKVWTWRHRHRGVYGLRIGLKSDPAFIGYSMGSASSIKSHKEVSGHRYYVHAAIEYGHAFPGRGGRKGAPKDVPAKQFIRPTIDSEKGSVERIINRRLIDELHGL